MTSTDREQLKFKGFSRDTIKFLEELRSNNNKPWFEAHKGEYERSVLEPLQNLVMDIDPFMLTIDKHFFSKGLVDDLISGFKLLAPFYHYLSGLKEYKK